MNDIISLCVDSLESMNKELVSSSSGTSEESTESPEDGPSRSNVPDDMDLPRSVSAESTQAHRVSKKHRKKKKKRTEEEKARRRERKAARAAKRGGEELRKNFQETGRGDSISEPDILSMSEEKKEHSSGKYKTISSPRNSTLSSNSQVKVYTFSPRSSDSEEPSQEEPGAPPVVIIEGEQKKGRSKRHKKKKKHKSRSKHKHKRSGGGSNPDPSSPFPGISHHDENEGPPRSRTSTGGPVDRLQLPGGEESATTTDECSSTPSPTGESPYLSAPPPLVPPPRVVGGADGREQQLRNMARAKETIAQDLRKPLSKEQGVPGVAHRSFDGASSAGVPKGYNSVRRGSKAGSLGRNTQRMLANEAFLEELGKKVGSGAEAIARRKSMEAKRPLVSKTTSNEGVNEKKGPRRPHHHSKSVYITGRNRDQTSAPPVQLELPYLIKQQGGVPAQWGTTTIPKPIKPPSIPPFMVKAENVTLLSTSADDKAKVAGDGTHNDDSDDLVLEEIMLDGRLQNVITSGPINTLIGMMARREIPEQNYIDAFILTHTYFMDSKLLISVLVDIFSRELDDKATQKEKEEFNKWRGAIRGRVVNVFLRWIERKFEDMATDPSLLSLILDFILEKLIKDESSSARMMQVLAGKLGKAIHKQVEQFGVELSDYEMARLSQLPRAATIRPGEGSLVPTTSAPLHAVGVSSAIMGGAAAGGTHEDTALGSHDSEELGRDRRKTVGVADPKVEKKKRPVWLGGGTKSHKQQHKTTFSELTPKQIAHQMTMLEQSMFRSVFPSEILCGNWKRANSEEVAPNILQLIQWFNRMTLWVATECVQGEKAKHRAKAITIFVQAAIECRNLKNYNTLNEIIMGLQTPTVKCLKQTWKYIERNSPEVLEQFQELVQLGNHEGNHAAYRTEFKGKLPPRLPYLAVHLGDVLKLDELPTFVTSKKHINFKKMRLIYEAAQPLLVKNDLPYEMPVNPVIQRYLTSEIHVLPEKEAYKLAKAAEAKS